MEEGEEEEEEEEEEELEAIIPQRSSQLGSISWFW